MRHIVFEELSAEEAAKSKHDLDTMCQDPRKYFQPNVSKVTKSVIPIDTSDEDLLKGEPDEEEMATLPFLEFCDKNELVGILRDSGVDEENLRPLIQN